MAFIQVIPAHFIDADGHLGFNPGINPLIDLAVGQKLVDEECGRMSVVEYQGVTQRYGLREPTPIIGNAVVEAVIKVICLTEILKDFSAFCLYRGAVKENRAGGVWQPS